jgi:uncharacterized membrane protein
MYAATQLAYDYPVLGAFWTVMWIFLWVLWVVLLFRVVTDLFRDRTLSGWGKAGWLLTVLVLPYLGVFLYVIARGRRMGEREARHAEERQQEFDAHLRQVLSGGESADDAERLAKLSDLKARGDLTENEFQHMKEKILH